MAIRIVGVDLPQNKRGEIALTYVYGIGRSSSAKIFAGVYGEKYLLVDFGTHTLRYLLGDDGIHDFICLSLKMKTPRKDYLTGCCVNLIMVSFLLG